MLTPATIGIRMRYLFVSDLITTEFALNRQQKLTIGQHMPMIFVVAGRIYNGFRVFDCGFQALLSRYQVPVVTEFIRPGK